MSRRAVQRIITELQATFRDARKRGSGSARAASTQSASAYSANDDMFDMELDDRAAAPQSIGCGEGLGSKGLKP